MKEKTFQDHIIRCARNKGWLVYHTYDSRRSTPGFPDLVLVREQVLYRELKAEKGKTTNAQNEWLQKLAYAGADVQIWRPSMIKEIYLQLT